MSFWDFILRNKADVWLRTVEHVGLVGLSTAIAVAIGVPVGVWISRQRRWSGPVIGTANVFQTIPSLALFGLLIPIPFIGGIQARTAIVALVVYALLPIVRNTYLGITGIDSGIRAAADGLGMTRWQMLRIVELPLAMPSILAGIRLAAVIGVGVATIAAAIGAGGLGVFIFRGLSMVNDAIILAGAVPAAVLALLIDGVLHLVERRMDWRH